MKNKSNTFISAEVLIWGVVAITHESDGLQSSSSQHQQISRGSTREQLQRSRICLLSHQCGPATSITAESWHFPGGGCL